MEYELLKILLSEEIHTEDMLMEKLNINEDDLESLMIKLESLGFLEENNHYFESTCDNCNKNGNCATEPYEPSKKVKKIRVITPKALSFFN